MKRRAGWLSGALLAVLVFAAPAPAATFDVTNPLDGLGACDADCTLREAVIAANANPGPDTIVLPAGVYAFSLVAAEPDSAAAGDLDLTDDVVITGAGPGQSIVDAQQLDRVFEVAEGVRVGMSGLTIRGGHRPRFALGGAGVYNSGELELTRVVVTGNGATSFEGGGIFSDGTLTLTDVVVANNGAFADGGIRSDGTATLTRVTVSSNSAEEGPAGIENRGTMSLSNSTISGNHTSFEAGGGISNKGSLSLRNVTIADNRTGGGGTALKVWRGEVTLSNTILDGTCDGQPTSLGHNLERGDTCGLRSPGDLVNVDPLLEPLADNGGPSQTHALLAGSPAIDAGDDSSCPATDQRGVTRPQGTRCDIGAYEAAAAPAGNTPPGSNVQVAVGPVTITFAQVSPPGGDTTVVPTAAAPPPPGGFRLTDPPAVYEIATTASYTAPIRVCLPTTDPAAQLFHAESGTWNPVASTFTGTHVCGDVTSLSPFALLVPVGDFRGQVAGLRDELAALALVGQQAKVRRQSAVEFLDKALVPAGWTADGRPKTNDNGRAALLQIRQCVQYLRTPNAELAAASAAIQRALSELVRAIAEARYADVSLAPGASSSRLLQARTSLDQAAAAPGTIEALYDAINAWSVLKNEPPHYA
jgi:hypothetical protein